MSTTSPIPDPINGIVFTAVGRTCFYCHGSLHDPAIYWMGDGTELFLHPSCVFPLFVRLCRDVHELECPDYYRRLREGR